MHVALGAAHVSRSDFVIHDGEPFFLELNTMPGLSAVSNVTECAAAAGLNYADLLALVVGAALGDKAATPADCPAARR
jgi:D-alanine-D-alanine ligase